MSYLKTVIENKLVCVDGQEYRLTVEKNMLYNIYLSAVENNFNTKSESWMACDLEKRLMTWIKDQHRKNNTDSVIEQIRNWDGVIQL